MTDSFVVVVVQEVSEPQCEWPEHSDPSKGFRHDGGPARFDLMMPCGYLVSAVTGDPLDRFHCQVCGQAWVVPSLALFCASRHDLPHEVNDD